MQAGRYVRGIAVALALGGLVLGLSAGQAEAKPKVDNGVRCAKYNSQGELEFYLDGDSAYAVGADGQVHQLVCVGGTWVDAGPTTNRTKAGQLHDITGVQTIP